MELHFGCALQQDISAAAEQARTLEGLGYEYISWGEHYMRGNPPLPTTAALPPLAVAAGATERIRLLSGVVLVPLYHPTMLAKMATSLDIASGGRLILGVGVGGEFPMEFEALQVPPKERGGRTDEGLDLLRRLWTEEHVSHEGRYYRVRDVTLTPPPMQKPHPPIWVAGRRDPAMRRAVRYGDGWFPYLYSPDRYRSSVARVQELAAEEGRSLTDFQWALWLPIAIYDTVEEAARIAAVQLEGRYLADTDFINLVGRFCLLGPVESCLSRLEEYIDAGVRHFIIALACEPRDAASHWEIVAQKIVPQFSS